MTLEDFLTLTEMKNGLSNLARVEELLLLIQNLKDFGASSGVDAVRQYSTVATTLALTENEECLNLFVQLNGLLYLNKWLQVALNTDVGGNFVEELISGILASFERLPIDRNKAITSGIAVTVENLLSHRSLQIKDKSRILCKKWNCSEDDKTSDPDMEKSRMTLTDHAKTVEEAQIVHISPGQGKIVRETCGLESAGTESHHSNVSEGSHQVTMNYGKVLVPNQILPSTSSNCIDTNPALRDVNSSSPSLTSSCYRENLSAIEESCVCAATEFALGDSHNSEGTKEEDADNKHDISPSQDPSNNLIVTETGMIEDNLCTSNQRDTCNDNLPSASSVPEAMQVAEAEPDRSCLLESKIMDSCVSKATDAQTKFGDLDCYMAKCLSTKKEKEIEQVKKGFQDICANESILSSLDDAWSSFRRTEAARSGRGTKEFGCDTDIKGSKGDILSLTDTFRTVDTKVAMATCKKSEVGLIDNALEVARQVAIAVEREVVRYREPFCSSPELISVEAAGACSPCSEDGKHDDPVIEEVIGNSSPDGTTEDNSGSDSSTKETSDITLNLSSDTEKSYQDLESRKLDISTHESVAKSDRRCNLDLNADICNEELEDLTKPVTDMPVNVSAPIAIFASSKGAPASPSIPLHFEGELGWKGCAATSAFRPASPRRTPDDERTFFCSKPKSSFLEIDLNVASGQDEEFVEPTPVGELPTSSSLPSGNSSLEVSSRKAEKLKLDLNSLGHEDVLAYPSSYWKLQHQNGEQSLSSASSSSARHPSVRDFDLNDNPSFLDVAVPTSFDKSSSKAFDTCGSSKLDDGVITIMGSRMSTERKSFSNQVHQSFMPNRLSTEPNAVARPLLSYAHMLPTTYGYSGLPSPQAFYSPGSFPYIVDSRGVTVFPQVADSGAYTRCPSVRPPFLMNVTGTTPNSLNFVSFQPGFELSPGMQLVDSGSEEGRSFKQFFLQGTDRFMEEERQVMGPSSSGMTLKRKEPEDSWEPYPHGYKQMAS